MGISVEYKVIAESNEREVARMVAAFLDAEGFMTVDDYEAIVRRVQLRAERSHELPASDGV